MKVGTDGTLLGAWARGGQRVLDIGTGTGLIALMMAQRYPEASLVAVDIDEGAARQARENVARSHFSDRIEVVCADVADYVAEVSFQAIVSNPPYFNHSLTSPDSQRTAARHTDTLSYRRLMVSAHRLLADDGELSIVIPFDCKQQLEAEALLAGFFKCRECAVRTTPRKSPRRYLMAFRKHPTEVEMTEGIIEISPGVRSPWYNSLCKDFYL